MTRYVTVSIVLFLVAASFGCRMCGSQYDYCMPAYTERGEDYRGCDPLYRAGSIFNSDKDYSAYFNDPDCIDCVSHEGGKANNAGSFGETRPLDKRGFPARVRPPKPSPIGIPAETPNGSGTDYGVPTIQQLIEGMPQPGMPVEPQAIPITPPTPAPFRETTPPPATEPPVPTPPIIESMPFTTQMGEPKITVEELRRLDPNVTEVKILNIDDSLNTALPKDPFPK